MAAFRLPRSLKVGYRRYRVSAMDPVLADAAKRDGVTDLGAGTIEIDTRNAPEFQVETLLHEVMHALWFDASRSTIPGTEEDIVLRLSPRLAAFMADNKQVVRQILDVL